MHAITPTIPPMQNYASLNEVNLITMAAMISHLRHCNDENGQKMSDAVISGSDLILYHTCTSIYLCVVRMTVLPSLIMAVIAFHTNLLVTGSIPLVGSSRNTTGG